MLAATLECTAHVRGDGILLPRCRSARLQSTEIKRDRSKRTRWG